MEVEDADGLYIDSCHDIGSTSCHLCTDTHTHKDSTSKTRNEKNKIKYIFAINPLAVHSSMCFESLQGIVVIGSQQRECSIITSFLGNLFLVQQRIRFCFGSCFFFWLVLVLVSPAEYISFFPHVLAFFMLWCHRCLKQIGRWLENWEQNCSYYVPVLWIGPPTLAFVFWLLMQLFLNFRFRNSFPKIYIYIYIKCFIHISKGCSSVLQWHNMRCWHQRP